MAKMYLLSLLAFFLLVPWATQATDRVYQTPDDFIAEVFAVKPQPKILWLTKESQAELTRILGHAPNQLRQRYWTDGVKTAFILEEIGKEDLITSGFVVSAGRVEQVRVLIYRESRGMEVRYPAFLDQFRGAVLSRGDQLDKKIDGISGATLSVQAMSRMTREALYLDRLAQQGK